MANTNKLSVLQRENAARRLVLKAGKKPTATNMAAAKKRIVKAHKDREARRSSKRK